MTVNARISATCVQSSLKKKESKQPPKGTKYSPKSTLHNSYMVWEREGKV